MYTLNKHVKWRNEKNDIFICDCKRLIDLKVNLEFEDVLKKFEKGIEEKNLNGSEKKLFYDFKKLKLLSELVVQKIRNNEFNDAIKIFDTEFDSRVRSNEFLFKKFKKFPNFFIGMFIDKQIIGIVCGFPREDYLLISELAVDSRFQDRGFGKRLMEAFEKSAKGKYNKINVGAEDNVVGFYSVLGYKPFLLIQYKKNDYSADCFKGLRIIKKSEDKEYERLEIKQDKPDMTLLKKLRKGYPKAYFQYIFTKRI